jgi:hypothetical protein
MAQDREIMGREVGEDGEQIAIFRMSKSPDYQKLDPRYYCQGCGEQLGMNELVVWWGWESNEETFPSRANRWYYRHIPKCSKAAEYFAAVLAGCTPCTKKHCKHTSQLAQEWLEAEENNRPFDPVIPDND